MPDGVSIILQVAPFSHDRSSHVRGAAVDMVVGRLVEGVHGVLSHSSRLTCTSTTENFHWDFLVCGCVA